MFWSTWLSYIPDICILKMTLVSGILTAALVKFPEADGGSDFGKVHNLGSETIIHKQLTPTE